MAGRGLRRTFTIFDQAKTQIKSTDNDDNASISITNNNSNNNEADEHRGLSLGHAAVGIPSPARGGRTLTDIIREEQKMSGAGSATGSIRNADDGTINWKSFRDRIRLRRAGTAWSDPDLPDPDPIPNPNPNPSIPSPALFGRSVSVRDSDDPAPLPIPGRPRENAEGGGGGGGGMSLMALFEQTEGGGFDDDEDEEEGEEDEEEEDDDEEELYHACCVCMVRHKGAAFIPCGHTLCRLCSKELLVSRGNCPLCNGFILEILDIF